MQCFKEIYVILDIGVQRVLLKLHDDSLFKQKRCTMKNK